MEVPDYRHLEARNIISIVSGQLRTAQSMTEEINRTVLVARAKEAVSLLPPPMRRAVLNSLSKEHKRMIGVLTTDHVLTPVE